MASNHIGDDGLKASDHKVELERNFSPLSMLGLAFAILNSWTALSASLSLALPSGGSTSVIWGLVTAGVCNLCIAVSLAEFLSAYPTAGGQYHWVAMISWKSWMPILSWTTGWINTAGWVALVCSGGLLASQLIVGIISFMIPPPAYEVQPWHQFLIYIAYNCVALVVNAFMTRLLPLMGKAAFIWSITGFVVITITVLSCAKQGYSSAEFVFQDFINETGWPDGIAWLLGLLQGGLGLIGYDAVAHISEEIPNPSVTGPRVMIACVAIGLFTGFIFLVALLFVIGANPVDDVIGSDAGPLLQIFYYATNSAAGAICLLIIPLICLLFATIGILTTSTRMTWAFAVDGGLPFSRFFSKVHPSLKVPMNALILDFVLVIIFGCIFLGSSSAFNAILSASVVALEVSYGIPIAINCARGRRMLGERPFVLSPIVGWTCNIIGLTYIIITSVLFVFPPDLPVDGTNMNYCIVAFAIVLLISTITWFVDGRKNFHGPKIDLDALAEGEIMGMGLEKTNTTTVGEVGRGDDGMGEKKIVG